MTPVFLLLIRPSRVALAGALLTGLAATAGLSAKTFTFTYAGKQRQFTWDIPQADLTYYKSQSHAQGMGKTYADYAKEEGDHLYISDLTTALNTSAAAEGFSEWEKVNYIIALVQSLNYFDDPQPYQDYVRYPIETLSDDGGDCEDTAILLAAILDRMGYSAALLNPPGHMATGIECSDCKGTKVSYNGNEYYYIETTGSGFNIGQMVLNFTSFNVFPLANSGSGEAIASNGEPSGLAPGGYDRGGNQTIPGGGGSNPMVIEWPDIKPFEMPGMGEGGIIKMSDFDNGTFKSSTTTLPDGSTVISYTITMPGTITMPQMQGSSSQMERIRQIQEAQMQRIQAIQQRQMQMFGGN